MQIKELQQQLATQQRNGSPANDSASNASQQQQDSSSADAPSSPPTPPKTDLTNARTGSFGASSSAGGTAGLNCSTGSTSSSSVWQRQLPWWQHAIVASLTAVSVAAYVQWEHSKFWAGC
jgi:hypothetical protein